MFDTSGERLRVQFTNSARRSVYCAGAVLARASCFSSRVIVVLPRIRVSGLAPASGYRFGFFVLRVLGGREPAWSRALAIHGSAAAGVACQAAGSVT